METRKIVKSGNTSFTLALPIEWVRKNNLEKSRLVQVSENDQGDLLISSQKEKETPKADIITIKVDGQDAETLYYELLTAYIRDHKSIVFEGKEIVRMKEKLLSHVESFIGLDVIEQSKNIIVVKNFFSLDKETSPQVLLRKMDITNRAGFGILELYFKRPFRNDDFFELQKLKEQNERLFQLTRKSILKLFEHPELMKEIQTTYLQVAKEKVFVQAFMQISASLYSVGRAFLIIDLKKKEEKELKKIFTNIYGDYKSLMNAINNNSYDSIYSFLKEYPLRLQEVDKLIKSTEDPMMIHAADSFLTIYQDLQSLAYEALA